MPSLFDPITLGALKLPNRILMAPLTRARGTRTHVPTPLMAEYYAQRADAGLIISEATGISQEGLGWPYAPGIWSDEQTEAWKPVVKAVHDAGGRIVCQLWHMGYLVHSDFLGGEPPVAPSVATAPDEAHTYSGKKPYSQARALREDEIPRLIADYERAARNAVAAGFDGVQIHAANGYLLDEFIRDGSNKRSDRYGGSPENRVRLVTKVAQAVAGVVGADRTGIRFSPNGPIQGVDDSNPHEVFGLAAEMMERVGLAFIEMREPGPDGTFGKATVPPVAPVIKERFGGPVILNCDYDAERAKQAVASGEADAIAFGRPFIANPDLVGRIAKGLPFAKDDMKTWYSQGPEGYVDYPTASQKAA